LDLKLLKQIKEYFEEIRKKYSSLIDPISEKIDTDVLIYQIPGGMLSNFVSQLKNQNALDRYEDVLKEVPRVREDLGYPPLVTPTSQIVGIQAVMNVLGGERYKNVTKEVKEYIKGFYGKPPAPINEEIAYKIIGDEERITVRPADLLEPEFEKYRKEGEEKGIIKKDEDVLTYALYPAVALKFLKGEVEEEPLQPPEEPSSGSDEPSGLPTEYSVDVDGEVFDVKITPVGYMEIEGAPKKVPLANVEGAVTTTIQGMILKLKVSRGDQVNEGDVVAVLEAMKMENDIHAPYAGTVDQVYVDEGDTVDAGEVLMVIK
jgi:pyruvate carboxylase subunit B